ncbi:hypothetical protein C8Q72DRAFT_974095 [Fomitopsis betulina]|nr:hypothetical protein C8Q72DRAFT_974095 [Fomitopsis betulina]
MIRLARASKMLRSTGDEHYRLLASDEDRNSPECDTYERTNSESAGPTRTSSFSHPVLRQVLGSMLFVVVIDAAFIVYIAYIFSTVYFDDTNLPLVNPYIGLEDLYRQGRVKPPHLPPLLNQPHVAMQVSHTEPHKPASIGVHQVWQTDLGGISTIDRHLLVDNKTSTIVQFRAMDFGMEECSLILHLPHPRDYSDGNESPTISDAPQLQICRIDAPRFLDNDIVTWASRPRCTDPPMTFIAALGEEQEISSRFPCQWGTYHSFEISCVGSRIGDGTDICMVDVWSSYNHAWGLYVYQHQTI